MKTLITFVYIAVIIAAVDRIAVAGESSVVYKNDGRSGYHAQRTVMKEPTTMAVYPKGKNVEVVVTIADRQIGSNTGSRGRSGYNYASRAID